MVNILTRRIEDVSSIRYSLVIRFRLRTKREKLEKEKEEEEEEDRDSDVYRAVSSRGEAE